MKYWNSLIFLLVLSVPGCVSQAPIGAEEDPTSQRFESKMDLELQRQLAGADTTDIISALLMLSKPMDSESEFILSRSGVTFRSISATILSVRGTPEQIRRLAAEDIVSRMEGARRHNPLDIQ